MLEPPLLRLFKFTRTFPLFGLTENEGERGLKLPIAVRISAVVFKV